MAMNQSDKIKNSRLDQWRYTSQAQPKGTQYIGDVVSRMNHLYPDSKGSGLSPDSNVRSIPTVTGGSAPPYSGPGEHRQVNFPGGSMPPAAGYWPRKAQELTLQTPDAQVRPTGAPEFGPQPGGPRKLQAPADLSHATIDNARGFLSPDHMATKYGKQNALKSELSKRKAVADGKGGPGGEFYPDENVFMPPDVSSQKAQQFQRALYPQYGEPLGSSPKTKIPELSRLIGPRLPNSNPGADRWNLDSDPTAFQATKYRDPQLDSLVQQRGYQGWRPSVAEAGAAATYDLALPIAAAAQGALAIRDASSAANMANSAAMSSRDKLDALQRRLFKRLSGTAKTSAIRKAMDNNAQVGIFDSGAHGGPGPQMGGAGAYGQVMDPSAHGGPGLQSPVPYAGQTPKPFYSPQEMTGFLDRWHPSQ